MLLVAACPALAVGCGMMTEMFEQPGVVYQEGLRARVEALETSIAQIRYEVMLLAGAGSLVGQGGASLVGAIASRRKRTN